MQSDNNFPSDMHSWVQTIKENLEICEEYMSLYDADDEQERKQ